MFKTNSQYINSWLAAFGIELNVQLPAQARQLVNDTRKIRSGDIFCAITGTAQEGRDYIEHALEKGCHLILVECEKAEQHGLYQSHCSASNHDVQVVEFYQLNARLFELAKGFYKSPQDKLKVIGVTGTNGKTSTSQMIAKLLDANSHNCSVIGTNGAGKVDSLAPIVNTTPGATELHTLLSNFEELQHSHVVMEVSSHALEQKRVMASLFNTAVFTNLTRDHLDYHHTMENYAEAKFKIFDQDPKQIAILNGDDAVAKKWLSTCSKRLTTIVFGRCDSVTTYQQFVHAKSIEHSHHGLSFELVTHVGCVDIKCQLIGDFNVDNLLAAIAVLITENISLTQISQSVSKLTPTIGRMESFSAKNLPLAVVDYAHTPDALENALDACRQHCQGALWVVFGCGGDRDVGKRPLMGRIAEQYSDHIIVTNDNPRTESAEKIAQDIVDGCLQPEKITVMLERQKAVLTALGSAKKNDVVLLAGKGHEDYIIDGTEHISYNERELVRSTYAHGAQS